MNKIITLAITTGMLSPVFVFGQIDKFDPSPDPVINFLTDQMESDKQDLYVEDIWRPLEGPAYKEIFFYSGAGDFWTDSSPGFQEVGSVADKKFVEISPNVSAFTLDGDGGTLDVGYFGNSSIDLNNLFLEILSPTAGITDLFLYDEDVAGSDEANPPRTAQVVNNYSVDAAFRFAHDDQTVGVIEDQGNDKKFKMFQAVDVADGDFITGEYIFAIDDRTNDAIDYDDGMFYINGNIAPVPEPSQIAALALIGLGGFLYLRRRLNKKS